MHGYFNDLNFKQDNNIAGSYCLEPWERKLFNMTMVTVLIMTIWTTYMFLPGWVASSISMMSITTNKLMLTSLDMVDMIKSEMGR